MHGLRDFRSELGESVTKRKTAAQEFERLPFTCLFRVEQRRVELLTSALRTRRSAKLSYCPTGEAR